MYSYQISAQNFRGKLKQNGCYRCGKKFEVGDIVVPRKSGGKTAPKYYHVSCWEETFIDIPDEETP